jgi:hypothetical protein
MQSSLQITADFFTLNLQVGGMASVQAVGRRSCSEQIPNLSKPEARLVMKNFIQTTFKPSDGVKLSYFRAGNGLPVILVHTLLASLTPGSP